MTVVNLVEQNTYCDSATLMLITSRLAKDVGRDNVAAMMATEANKEIMDSVGLLTKESLQARPNDIIFAVRAETDANAEELLSRLRQDLQRYSEHSADRTASDNSDQRTRIFRPQDEKLRAALCTLNSDSEKIALISVPGDYAVLEARRALQNGLHVLLFSDNVSLEDEHALKLEAAERDLLVMGPDCGSAIISGVPLAFSNQVRKGCIGIVAAAGTGLQEVACQIHRHGAGVSHAIGTGGRDVRQEIGGLTMLAAIDALEHDPDTKVLLIVSKTPDSGVYDRVMERLSVCRKPVVVCFVGFYRPDHGIPGVFAAESLEKAAYLSVRAEGTFADMGSAIPEDLISGESRRLSSGQDTLRGLYMGGTLCSESLAILRNLVPDVRGNGQVLQHGAVPNLAALSGNVILDLGADEFTRGKPHPMIEPSLRDSLFVSQAHDPSVAVILFDVVIGYGAYEDPARSAVEQILDARKIAATNGRHIVFVASVCGTDDDPQSRVAQKNRLEEHGVIVCRSNAEAAAVAGRFVTKTGEAK